MKQKFLKYISNNGLFSKNDSILIAVSGGLDSVVLLDLLFKTNFSISIAHCNFQLRGNESDEDEEFVKTLGKNYNLKTFVKTCNAAEYAKTNKLSIQESARELRYTWFEKILTENGFNKLAVAHHFDDNLETFFINFSRGSGLGGLKGIPVKNARIVRPLMFASRNQIEEYAIENNIDFREDSSNKSNKYLRNNLRHKLIPTLKKVLANSDAEMQKSMDHLAQDRMLFEQMLDEKRKTILEKQGQQIAIDKNGLLKLRPLGAWLYYLLKPFGFVRGLTDEITSAIEQNKSGKQFFSSTHRLITDRDKLFLNSISEILDNQEYVIKQGEKEIKQPIKLTFSIVENNTDFKIEKKKDIAHFDFDKLSFPLRLRRWKKGDRFHPFGMKGSKLLSDYFIDEKLNLLEKENIWLLVSGDKIIWVVGMRTSDLFKLEASSKKVLNINFRKHS